MDDPAVKSGAKLSRIAYFFAEFGTRGVPAGDIKATMRMSADVSTTEPLRQAVQFLIDQLAHQRFSGATLFRYLRRHGTPPKGCLSAEQVVRWALCEAARAEQELPPVWRTSTKDTSRK